jgi:hypothetical protein
MLVRLYINYDHGDTGTYIALLTVGWLKTGDATVHQDETKPFIRHTLLTSAVDQYYLGSNLTLEVGAVQYVSL